MRLVNTPLAKAKWWQTSLNSVTTVQKLATPEAAYSGALVRDTRHCPRSTVGESSTNRTCPERLPATSDFRFARPSERIAEALRSVVFLSLSTLLGTSPFPTPSREPFMVLPGGCLSALLADASRADHFGEGVLRTIRLLRYLRHVIFLSQTLPLSHRLAFFFLCRPVFPNRIIGPCAWLPSPVLRRRQYIWGRPDWCASA
jgi:hypothetical protein